MATAVKVDEDAKSRLEAGDEAGLGDALSSLGVGPLTRLAEQPQGLPGVAPALGGLAHPAVDRGVGQGVVAEGLLEPTDNLPPKSEDGLQVVQGE